MINGYMGKMLFVDLTSGKLEEKELTVEIAQKFIGGYGIGARVLYDMMEPGADPLGPDNVLGFTTGPLTGTGAFFSGRFMVVCKSPVTGGWNDSNCGGHLGPELKKAGYDAVFIKGVSEKPVYLWINDGKAELRDASKLWGKDTYDTEVALKEELGEPKIQVACIGPAGEKMSLISAIISEAHRAAGRGGVGAVMGSKKLKAVVARGAMNVPVADPGALREINKLISDSMKKEPVVQGVSVFGAFGTGSANASSALSGDSPVKNWGGVGLTDFGEENAKGLDVISKDTKYKTKKYACANCPIGCGAHYVSDDGEWPVGETERPEYETSAAFGSMLLNNNYDAVIKCNHICNRYGLDTISAGATISWATECYENGIITNEEAGGIELKWGNAQAIVKVTQEMADQSTEFGKTLALGSSGAAQKLGKGFEYLQTVKGIELPMHDPKLAPGLSRIYECDPTPARHVKGGIGQIHMATADESKYTIGEKDGFMDAGAAAFNEVSSCAGLCMFNMHSGVQDALSRQLKAVTGKDFGQMEITQAGTRIFTMRQLFNVREGLRPADFTAPKRSVGEPSQQDGPVKGVTIDHKKMAGNFYRALDWNMATGKPSKAALERLGGLENIVEELY